MLRSDRRPFLAGLAGAAVLGAMPWGRAAAESKPLKLLMNSDYTGANAWFAVAQDKGYLREEGIEVEFTPGLGAYTAAPRIVPEGFDAGYGDINSLIEVVAANPEQAPIAVYMMFNAAPTTIVVAADGPIKGPQDLEGHTIGGHPTDVALRTFPAFAKLTGVDASKVKIVTSDESMRVLVGEMLAGKTDGVFGYVTTQTAAAITAGIDPAARLRFISYPDYVPDLYGSALMINRQLLRNDPKAVSGLIRALNAALIDIVKDPDGAIEVVARYNPEINKQAERARLEGTLKGEMAGGEGKTLGIGAVDEARLARSIALIAETNKLPRVPAPGEVFTPDFLPPLADRVTTLAG